MWIRILDLNILCVLAIFALCIWLRIQDFKAKFLIFIFVNILYACVILLEFLITFSNWLYLLIDIYLIPCHAQLIMNYQFEEGDSDGNVPIIPQPPNMPLPALILPSTPSEYHLFYCSNANTLSLFTFSGCISFVMW